MAMEARWKKRFEKYISALRSLEEVTPRAAELSALEQDGLIQRFEFTFELAWKVMKDFLEDAGHTGMAGPRYVIKQMVAENLIERNAWEQMLDVRNALSHIYDEALSREYVPRITGEFVQALVQFRNMMQQR